MGGLLWLDNKLEGYKEFGYVFRWVNILGKVLKCIFLGNFFNLVMIVGKNWVCNSVFMICNDYEIL